MSEYKDIETVKHSFVVREDDKTQFTAIRIDEGKFKGVIYLYDDVQVGTETEDGGLNLHLRAGLLKALMKIHLSLKRSSTMYVVTY